jgi:hypothetical protein
MKLGSKQHRQQYCEGLLKTYHENVWQDELNLNMLQQSREAQVAAGKVIAEKIANKEFKTKNEGDKAKFVAERELLALDKEIAAVTEKINALWPSRIKQVEGYLAKE